jgi:regulatory protein
LDAERRPGSALAAALRALARRELSAAQLTDHLLRRGHAADDVAAAIARLTAERLLDDARLAAALARQLAERKGRGPARIVREIERRGIAPPIAREAVRAAFADGDEAALVEQYLDRHPPTAPVTQGDLARLYRALLRRGFATPMILSALRRRYGATPQNDE